MRFLLAFCLLALPVFAEDAEYGAVWLSGMARDSWHLNPLGPTSVMVCNVNGPDGYLSIRSGPGTQYDIRRNLGRLVILTIDTSQRQGHWIRVLDAHRDTDADGNNIPYKPLPVEGWAHDGYMCDFVH